MGRLGDILSLDCRFFADAIHPPALPFSLLPVPYVDRSASGDAPCLLLPLNQRVTDRPNQTQRTLTR